MINPSEITNIIDQLTRENKPKSTVIQSLWSGYGELSRIQLEDEEIESVIVKNINFQSINDHPRGWNTDRSHQRKVKSYEVEVEWYKNWAARCDDSCKVPKCYSSHSADNKHLIILEDLDASGFPLRKSSLKIEEAKLVLKWLANFHALFLNETPARLWEEGTYWHLATRPDELKAMKSGELKNKASQLDQILRNCSYKTIVHGDAKVANFCFSKDLKQVAAVDFQYVGGGCGMKDVVYFLGSCLTEKQCEREEELLLNTYFNCLKTAIRIKQPHINFNGLEKEWRYLYPIAWADFTRFLLGWMPTHQKLNGYSLKMIQKALEL